MREGSVTIFHLTDIHGRVEQEESARRIPGSPSEPAPWDRARDTWAGLASVEAELVRQVRRSRPGVTLFLHAGDLLGIEMPHDRYGDGRLSRAALTTLCEAAGVDRAISAVGNHEMDLGIDTFMELIRADGVEYTCSNLMLNGEPPLPRSVELSLDGWRIAVVSLTTLQTETEAPEGTRARLRVDPRAGDPVLTELCERRSTGGLDLLIVLAHLSDAEDAVICERWPAIDLLIGGHSHNLICKRPSEGPWYGKAQCHAMLLGLVRFAAEGGVLRRAESWLLPLERGDATSARVSRGHRSLVDALEVSRPDEYGPLAALPRPIRGCDVVRTDECPIGRLVANVLLQGARARGAWAHVAFINGGNIRADLVGHRGQARRVDLEGVVPYRNEVRRVVGTPALLRRILANAVVARKLDQAGFLQTAGLRWSIDARARLGEVWVEVSAEGGRVDWVRLDDLEAVELVTIDWLTAGNHGYPRLDAAVSLGLTIVALWRELLAGGATLSAPPLGDFNWDEALDGLVFRELVRQAELDAGETLSWAWDRVRLHELHDRSR